MFYYPNVLQRHTGCFSTIWLAATRGSKIVKREYLKVNVIKTCQQIMQYILHQAPAPYPSVPVPRLSLYLSAQLSYGVVCVYHRQCDLLIEEMKNTLERLYRAEKQMKIDLLQPEQQLLLPDGLSLMQMLETAPDPFFGMMGIPPELPDPFMIPQIRVLVETPSPERARMEETPPRPKRLRVREDTEHITSPERITIREMEPITLPSIEIVRDLPEVSAYDLEFLMSGLPPFPEEDTIPKPRKRDGPPRADDQERPTLPDKPKDRKKRLPKEKELESQITEKVQEFERERFAEAERMKEQLNEIEREKAYLRELQIEKEHIQISKIERELRRKTEGEIEQELKIKGKRKVKEEFDSDRKLLEECIREIGVLRENGIEGEPLEELLRKKEQLRKSLKEKKNQWEAAKMKELLKESEREKERRREDERERERYRQIETEIETVENSLRLKEQDLEKSREREIELERQIEEASIDEIRKREAELLTTGLSPTSGFLPEISLPPDADVLLEEVPGQPISAPGDVIPEKLTLLGSPLLSSPLIRSPQLQLPDLSVEERPLTLVKRRRRLIIDKETQIGSKIMKEQLIVPDIYTHAAVPVTIPHKKCRTPSDLLHTPTYSRWMAPELSELWSRCAILEHLPFLLEREEEREETMSEMEAVRAATEPSVSLGLSSEISLEVSEEERSRPILMTPEERRALSMSDDRLLPVVHEMPEVMVDLPEADDIAVGDVERNICSHVDREGHTEFRRIAPCSISRMLASRIFYNCLALSTQQIIRLEQMEPYGQIVITPGRRYTQD